MKKTIMLFLMLLGLLTGCAGQEEHLPDFIPVETMVPDTVTAEVVLTPENLNDYFQVKDLTPYTGPFMECEPDYLCRVENVYGLEITNVSDQTVLNAELKYTDGNRELCFYVEILPPGVTIMMADPGKNQAVAEKLEFTGGAVDYLDPELENPDAVEITPTQYNTLEVKNLTKETLPTVWIFYRDCDRFGNILGGRCFSVMAEQIRPDDTCNAESSQWLPSCKIMDVLVVYPEETQ